MALNFDSTPGTTGGRGGASLLQRMDTSTVLTINPCFHQGAMPAQLTMVQVASGPLKCYVCSDPDTIHFACKCSHCLVSNARGNVSNDKTIGGKIGERAGTGAKKPLPVSNSFHWTSSNRLGCACIRLLSGAKPSADHLIQSTAVAMSARQGVLRIG